MLRRGVLASLVSTNTWGKGKEALELCPFRCIPYIMSINSHAFMLLFVHGMNRVSYRFFLLGGVNSTRHFFCLPHPLAESTPTFTKYIQLYVTSTSILTTLHIEGPMLTEVDLKACLHYTLEPASNGANPSQERLHCVNRNRLQPEPALSRTTSVGGFERVPCVRIHRIRTSN